MNILLWIVFGGLAGWIATLILGSGAGIGVVLNIIIGVAGAFLGGWIADKTGFQSGDEGADRPTSFWGFLWAVAGAVIVLLLINLIV